MVEEQLVKVLCATQVVGSVFAFAKRYRLAGFVYGGDKR